MARVIHFEVHAENPERAARFYHELFGWELTRWEGPMDYWVITTGPSDQPGINGGLLRRHGPAPIDGQPVNAYVCTLGVESVDQVLEAAPTQGGSIAMPKMAVPGVGWLGYLKDTEGNIFGVMQEDPTAR